MLNSPSLLKQEILNSNQYGEWQWPAKPVYSFSDMHADTGAFLDSLIVSGGARKTGSADNYFRFSSQGKEALFIIVGDCLDKGPVIYAWRFYVIKLFKKRS